MSSPTAFDDEVITRSLVRYLDLPGLSGPLALITLDNGLDHKRPSTFGPGGLSSLYCALNEIDSHTPSVSGIAVTGKPFIFAVGADLSGMPKLQTREQAREIAQMGHDVFRRLTESSVPTFAFINGATLGGGLELALSCHYRTLSTGANALAFPECFLGIVPGWGGVWQLPNLIGADRAVTVIIENALSNNRMLRAAQAHQLGISDLLLEPADFLERSIEWAVGVITGGIQVERPEVDRGQAWDDAIARGRAVAEAKFHGAAPAPLRALDLMAEAKTASMSDSYNAQVDVLGDLLMTDELRSGLYSFDLVQKRARRPAGAPDKSLARKVGKVGVIGAGLMASQLALLFAHRLQVPVVLTDIDQERIDKGVAYVHGEIDKLAAKGRIAPDMAGRLKTGVTGSLTMDAFEGADFVIEAVFEEMKVKQQVFAEAEAVVSPECILATNTSSLSISDMASGLQHPERVVGFHFFNPVAVLPLLEVIRGEHTDDAALATALSVGKDLKKSCVLVKDAPAFVVNRLLTRFIGEIIAAVDEGTPFEVADTALTSLGLPMSPFVLLALVGPAVALHVNETLHEAYPDRFGLSENFQRLVEARKPGIYAWDEKGRPYVDPEVAELFTVGDSPSSQDEVRTRALTALAQEIGLMLEENVVAAADDIDLCMLLGAGWPFHLGGITPYLDRSGIAEKVTGSRFHPPGVASVPG
ncbi:MAG TPA: 3-hydroxyacyl-CoA dehydrogenase NAD-binding domain-containing protein [Mycobacteriales bacterium]|nr:3-hydroxyacyl-CoA dehydrogenase NAD-binding domain-containing protein [Mycobacteriales bacterium]